MQALLAIARLTFKAAFRFRLVPVLAVLLIGGVLLLPAVIISDGTARGLTQIVLTYTLGLTTLILGITTLWLACGTLAKDIEECQIQVVAVKPVPRWQIWLGKWLGIMFVNALLLSLAAAVIYVQLQWRARGLPPEEQATLRNEVFVARGSFKPPPPDIQSAVDRLMEERLKNANVAALDRNELRRIVTAQVKASYQVVRPDYMRTWKINLGPMADRLKDQPLFLRIKFYVGDTKKKADTYTGIWEIGPEEGPRRQREILSQAPETFHEIKVLPNLIGPDGVLTVQFINQNDVPLLFQDKDGLEVLYREGGFLLNYARGVAILGCWLALLTALGLAASSQLSFPVAAFVSLGLLVVAFSTGTMRTVIEQGTIRAVDHETGMVANPNFFDAISVGFFKVLLWIINLVRGFSPVEQLSDGRSITWGTLALAVYQIVFIMGGLFALLGIVLLHRRELATAQNQT